MGEYMLLSELQNKTLINILDGKNVGNIIDVKIDSEKGGITSLIIEPNKKGLFSGKNNYSEIGWKNIKKIGEDVILIDITLG